MAYVYGNSTSASVSLIVFGLIQIAMFVSSFFGCRTEIIDSFASQAWSGGFAVFTGLFGICMVKCYKEPKWGSTFCIFAFTTVVLSLANLALILGVVLLEELRLTNEYKEATGFYDLTGMAIYCVGVLAGIAVLITSMVASCICCCCEKSPGKGYTVSSVDYTEHRDDNYNTSSGKDTIV